MLKRLFIYLILVTVLFARMDFNPIHYSYINHGKFPNEDVYRWWKPWTTFRGVVGKIFCPPCAALAEQYYFVLFEIEASTYEQKDLLLKHAPYDGILSPNIYWGQGGEDNSNPWKKVSLLAWYLYWLPYTVLWWWLYAGDLFNLRTPFILRILIRQRKAGSS